MKNKKVLIISGVMLMLVMVGVIVFSDTNKKTTPPTQRATHIVPSHETAPTAVPTTYEEKLVDRFDNRKPLSEQDQQAKQTIIATAPDHGSGTVYQSANIHIQYTQLADLIQIEVRTREIQKAKEEAVTWLKSKGMTQEGICYAPVQFYPSFDLNQELKQKGIEFNPLAPGC